MVLILLITFPKVGILNITNMPEFLSYQMTGVKVQTKYLTKTKYLTAILINEAC